MRNLTVQIPRPCHEHWGDMKPTEQGRFCASCQKTVIDFSTLSDWEVVRLLNEPMATTCGRFRNDQLNRPLALPTQVATPVWYRWLGVLTLGLLGWQTARAGQSEVKIQPTTTLPNQSFTGKASRDTTAPNSGRFIAGTVVGIDSMGKSYPVPGANVVIQGTTLGTQTDHAGVFRLLTPADMPMSLVRVVVSAIGFTRQEIDPFALALDSTIVLNEDTGLLEEVVSVGEYELAGKPSGWKSPAELLSRPSRWQRIKRKLFQKSR